MRLAAVIGVILLLIGFLVYIGHPKPESGTPQTDQNTAGSAHSPND